MGRPIPHRCPSLAARKSSTCIYKPVPKILLDMDAAGLERCIMLGWYWEHQETCDLQNSWYGDWIKAHPDRLSAFATVQPKAGDRALAGLEKALAGGLCGIGEIKPQAQGFSFADDCWLAVMEFAHWHKLPINLHVTDPVIFQTGSQAMETPLPTILRLVEKYPQQCFILAHWGGGLPFYELNPGIRQRLRNVYYDSAASPLLYDPTVYAHVLELIGPDRILFGSDYPLLCFSKTTRQPEFQQSLKAAEEALKDAVLIRKILRENSLRMLNG
jgi:uncharacterized protein